MSDVSYVVEHRRADVHPLGRTPYHQRVAYGPDIGFAVWAAWAVGDVSCCLLVFYLMWGNGIALPTVQRRKQRGGGVLINIG